MEKTVKIPKPRNNLLYSDALTCLSVIGVVVSLVMAVKATPKAIKLLENSKDDKQEELTPMEVIKIAGPAYIPSAMICLGTITCIFGINMLNKRTQASLASAYALLDQSYQGYKKAAKSVYGDDADEKIKIQAANEMYISADGCHIYHPEVDCFGEQILFYDTYSQRYFQSTLAAVLNAQYHLNRNFILRGEVCINEFYAFLGIDKMPCGDDIGWGLDNLIESGIMWLDFDNCPAETHDREYYIISAFMEPTMLSGYED